MKRFAENAVRQVIDTYVILLVVFTAIHAIRGVESVPVARLIQLAGLSVPGGILMEFAFGKLVFPMLADAKRVCLFIVPFCLCTFVFSLVFGWFGQEPGVLAYAKFIGIFLACWVLSLCLFEVEHRLLGKRYTEKLRAYQKKGGEK